MQSFNHFCGGFERDFLYLLLFVSWYNLCRRLPRDFNAISLPPFLHISSLGWWITKDLTTHWKTLPITHYRVSTFAAVLKGIFFIYCFLSFNPLSIPVCRAILRQYLSDLSYTFHHLVGELQKTLQRIAKLCSLNRCEVSTTFLTFWSWFPLFLHFTFCTICIFAYCADCFGYIQQHGKICNVIKFRFTQKTGITQKVIITVSN